MVLDLLTLILANGQHELSTVDRALALLARWFTQYIESQTWQVCLEDFITVIQCQACRIDSGVMQSQDNGE
jgi:hypothetical protein